MKHLTYRLRGVLIAFAALALSAGLAFGAQPPEGWGLANASEHAGKTVPVKAGQLLEDEEDVDEDEDVDDEEDDEEVVEEDLDEDVDEELDDEGDEDGDNCSTDPRTLTDEALAELKHGSIVCWAAHQTEWPEWFTKHGEFVKCWAHNGKADSQSCTEDPDAELPETEDAAASAGKGRGKLQDKANGHDKVSGQDKGKGKSRTK